MKKWILSCILLILIGLISISMFVKNDSQKFSYRDNTPQFIHEEATKVIQMIDEKKKGIYYFGFPTCPWCIELLPIFNMELKNSHEKSYVVNTRSAGFTDANRKKLRKIYSHYSKNTDLEVPLIFSVNRIGNLKIHVGTVKGHDAKTNSLSGSQKLELENKLDELIHYKNSSK